MRCCGLALVSMLVACTSLPQAVGVRSYAGKFTVQVADAEHPRAVSGRFTLTVEGRHLTLDLGTPLGTTLARVQSDPGAARLTISGSDGPRTEEGPDAFSLSERVLGWAVPVDGLAYWIEGRPSPDRPYSGQASPDGGSAFEQDGWQIHLAPRDADGVARRLQLDRPALERTPAVRVRVVLDSGAQG
jgi:outer membrane lipoprotein LolB